MLALLLLCNILTMVSVTYVTVAVYWLHVNRFKTFVLKSEVGTIIEKLLHAMHSKGYPLMLSVKFTVSSLFAAPPCPRRVTLKLPPELLYN